MEDQIEGEALANLTLRGSVVKPGYKLKYAMREAAMKRRPKGLSRKVLARCNGDWLALELARYTLDEKGHSIVALFEQVLTDNGVRHEHWNRTSKGWQGRLRMTGRLALETRIVAQGFLSVDGTQIEAPKVWVKAHTK